MVGSLFQRAVGKNAFTGAQDGVLAESAADGGTEASAPDLAAALAVLSVLSGLGR